MSFQPKNSRAAASHRGKFNYVLFVFIFLAAVVTAIMWQRGQNNREAELPFVRRETIPASVAQEKNIEITPVKPAAVQPKTITAPEPAVKVTVMDNAAKNDSTAAIATAPQVKGDSTINPATPQQALQYFFAQTTKSSQFFTIDAGKANTVTAAEGARITIPANAFVNSQGQPVTGAIQLEVKEAYKYDDMITAGLTTLSNGQMLVSGGMIFTNATQNGHALKMAEDKRLGITMPAAEFDKDMQLFTPGPVYRTTATRNDTVLYDRVYGEQSINWQPAGQQQWQPVLSNVVFTPHDGRTNIFSFTDEPYKTKSTRRGLKAWFAISSKAPMTVQEAEAAIKKNFIGYHSVKVKRANSEDEFRRSFLSNVYYPVIGDSTRMTVPDAVRWRYIKPADSMAFEQKRKNDSIRYMHSQAYEYYQRKTNPAFYLKYEDRFKDYSEWYERFKKDAADELRELEQKRAYVFSTGKLGWINCDRFYDYNGSLQDFIVKLPGGMEAKNFKGFLIFKDMQSIYGDAWCNGNQIKFPDLPVNLSVYFVAVGVVNGQTYTVIEETKTGGQPVEVKRLLTLSPQEFKREMAVLTGAAGQTAMK